MSPLEFLLRVPPEAIIKETFRVLDGHASPGRVPIFSLSASLFDADFVFGVVRNSWLSVNSWNQNIEAAKIILSNPKFISVPVIELTKD